MSTHGIFLGGTVGVALYCLLRGKNFLSVADELAIAGAFIMGVCRLGNFIDGQIVGSLSNAPWAIKFPDAEGFRHPVVLYDGLKNLALVPLLILLRPGCLIVDYCWAYSSSVTDSSGSLWISFASIVSNFSACRRASSSTSS